MEFIPINAEIEIGKNFVDCASYEQFLRYQISCNQNEKDSVNRICYPYHWSKPYYENGYGTKPLVGILAEDADAFCQWLSQEYSEPGFKYRLPTPAEANQHPIRNDEIGYWCKDHSSVKLKGLNLQHLNVVCEKISKVIGLDCSNEVKYIYETNFRYSHEIKINGDTYLNEAIGELREIHRIRCILPNSKAYRHNLLLILFGSLILNLFSLLSILERIVKIPFYLIYSTIKYILFRISNIYLLIFIVGFLGFFIPVIATKIAMAIYLSFNISQMPSFIEIFQDAINEIYNFFSSLLPFVSKGMFFMYFLISLFFILILVKVLEYFMHPYIGRLHKKLQKNIAESKISSNMKVLKTDKAFDSKINESLRLGDSLFRDMRELTNKKLIRRAIKLFQNLAEIYNEVNKSPDLLPEYHLSTNARSQWSKRWLARRNELLSIHIFTSIINERKSGHIRAFEGIRLVREKVALPD